MRLGDHFSQDLRGAGIHFKGIDFFIAGAITPNAVPITLNQRGDLVAV